MWFPAPDGKFKILIFDNLIWQIAVISRIEKMLIKYIQKTGEVRVTSATLKKL